MWGSGCAMWVPRVGTHFSPKHGTFGITNRTCDTCRGRLCVDRALGLPASAHSVTWLFFLGRSELESSSQGDGIQSRLHRSGGIYGFVPQEGRLGKCLAALSEGVICRSLRGPVCFSLALPRVSENPASLFSDVSLGLRPQQ